MLWLIFALLLIMGVVSFFTSYTMLGGGVQIVLIGALGRLESSALVQYRAHSRYQVISHFVSKTKE